MPFSRQLAVVCFVTAASLLLSQGREKRVSPLPPADMQLFERSHGSVGVAILVGVGNIPGSVGSANFTILNEM